MHHTIDKYFDDRYAGLIGNYRMPGELDELGRAIGPDGWVDGGDTLHRVGFYASGLWYRRQMGASESDLKTFPYNTPLDYQIALIQLECKRQEGWYRRHPDPDFWYSLCHVNSRDQDSPNLIAMALNKMPRLWRYFKRHALRFFLFTGNTRKNGSTPENHGQKFRKDAEPLKWYHKLILKLRIPILPVPDGYRNYNWKIPDPTFIGFWSYYVRGLYHKYNIKDKKLIKWVFLAILNVMDISFLINARIIRDNPDDNDIVNHLNASAFAHFVAPTYVSRYMNENVNDAEDFKRRLELYFKPRKSPAFLRYLWNPIIDEVMG